MSRYDQKLVYPTSTWNGVSLAGPNISLPNPAQLEHFINHQIFFSKSFDDEAEQPKYLKKWHDFITKVK